MYKAIIVDDEDKLREVLKIKLNQHCPEIDVVDQAENAEQAYQKIQAIKPDVVFLDISMPGESGLDLLKRFPKLDFEVIFVTGFNNYVLDALRMSAVDYILKPVSTSDLKEAVLKAKSKISERKIITEYDVLRHNMATKNATDFKVAIPNNDSYDFVKLEEIIRCEGWQKYTKVYLNDGRVLTSSYNIGTYREMLEKYEFFSCHKSHLINTSHIVKYHKDGNIILTDGSNVPVARRRKDEFMEKIVRFLGMI